MTQTAPKAVIDQARTYDRLWPILLQNSLKGLSRNDSVMLI